MWLPIAADKSSSFFVIDGGLLMSCGFGTDNGVLGHGKGHDTVPTPTALSQIAKVRINQVATGYGFVVAVSAPGTVYTWGNGNYGCLGHGDTEGAHFPKQIQSLAQLRILSVAAGDFHCLAVTEDGEVFSWGADEYGRCGHCDDFKQWPAAATRPRRIDALAGIRARSASASDYHSIVTTESGALYTFGYGAHGKVTRDGDEEQCSPTLVHALQHVRIVCASTGGRHTLALADDGAVFSWGNNRDGQLGVGSSGGTEQLPKRIHALRGVAISSVYTGWASSYALSTAGELFAWGNGEFGQLGHGDTANDRTPRRVDALHGQRVVVLSPGHRESVMAVTNDGRVFGWGSARGFDFPENPKQKWRGLCRALPCEYPNILCKSPYIL